jgi:hypothetical protein
MLRIACGSKDLSCFSLSAFPVCTLRFGQGVFSIVGGSIPECCGYRENYSLDLHS